MKIFHLIWLCVSVLFCLPDVNAQDDWPAERKERATKAGEERMAFAASKDFAPYSRKDSEAAKKVDELMEKNDFDAALKAVDTALVKYPCDIDLWVSKTAILRAKGDETRADEARQRWFGLIDSILMSGDGKSCATVFKVISLREEHALMSILGINPGDQWLIFYEGEPFDKRVVTTKNGAEAVLFFNVGIPMKHLQKKISEAKKNPKK